MGAEVATSLSGVARRIGRYVIFDEIAAGGMAVVHLGRLRGSVGFARTVAIKRLHAHFAKDPEFVSMFTDEARLAARIRHPNVAATLDVVTAEGELFLIMEYIHGETLAKLLKTASKEGSRIPIPVAIAIASGMLHGLHAAHEATTEDGAPLRVVHRDVSPQNVMVGVDGLARVLDFGVAKAVGRLQTTRDGEVKGKTAYMSPEQLKGRPVDRRADVYAGAVVLWETLTGHRLFVGDTGSEVLVQVLSAEVEPPSRYAPEVPPELDALVLRGLARDPDARFATALEMAVALERAILLPTPREVGTWVYDTTRDVLAARATRLRHIEQYGAEVAAGVAEPEIVSAIAAIGGDDALTVCDAPASQISSISVSTPIATRSTPKRRRLIVALALTVVALGAGLGSWRIFHKTRAVETATATLSPVLEASATSAPVTSTPVTSTPVTSAPVPGPSAAEPPVVASGSVRGRSKVRPPARPKPSRAPAAHAKPSCDPPYTVDPDGIHIPKAACD